MDAERNLLGLAVATAFSHGAHVDAQTGSVQQPSREHGRRDFGEQQRADPIFVFVLAVKNVTTVQRALT
jgi:hypothetical protein